MKNIDKSAEWWDRTVWTISKSPETFYICNGSMDQKVETIYGTYNHGPWVLKRSKSEVELIAWILGMHPSAQHTLRQNELLIGWTNLHQRNGKQHFKGCHVQ
jgi:hypothetical protein